MAITDNVASKLLDLDELLQEQYHNVYLEQVQRQGRTINRVFRAVGANESIEVSSDGITFQVNRAFGDTFRTTNAVHDEFPVARYFDPAKIKARYTEAGTSAMDFTVFQGSAAVTDVQLETGGDGAIIDASKRVVKEMRENYDEALAKKRNLARTARIALVNGTPKQNDTYLYSTAAATPTNLTGARFPIDNGSIAMFTRGQHLDFYSSAGVLRAGNVEVTDVKYEPDQVQIGVKWNTASSDPSTGTGLNTIADNDEIFLSGERNKGMYSFEAWFSRPAASGDSFIGGLDRNAADNRWLICAATREGSTATQIAPSFIDDAGNTILFKSDETLSVVAHMHPLVETTLRQRLDSMSVVQQPPDGVDSDRMYQFGAKGVMFQNPVFGAVKCIPDPLAQPNTVHLLVANDWRTLTYGWSGLRTLPGWVGSWSRLPQSTPGSGYGKVWKQDAYAQHCDYCLTPSRQVAILNVTA